MQIVIVVVHALFLSTLSLRRATSGISSKTAEIANFYPRSPCGERRISVSNVIHLPHFYPRSPCGERRQRRWLDSTHRRISIHALLAESDQIKQICRKQISISIHALLAESDNTRGCKKMELNNFYPRSPCGERLELFAERFCNPLISIHALLAESDAPGSARLAPCVDFYPRSPCGERQKAC